MEASVPANAARAHPRDKSGERPLCGTSRPGRRGMGRRDVWTRTRRTRSSATVRSAASMNIASSTTPPGQQAKTSQWMVVREVPEGGVSTHVHHGAYGTIDWAKRAAELWEGSAG
jgi:hypothetical protein